MSSVPEKDWKLFRKLQNDLTDKACDQIFNKVEKLSKNRSGTEHSSYLALYNLIQSEDKKIAKMFDNPTRNNVLMKLVALMRFGVLTQEQFQKFSQETQDSVESLLKLTR